MNDRGTATGHHVDDELPGYALDALDPPEQSIVARHLRVCPRCQRLAENARTLVAQLAFAAPPGRPPAYLRARVLDRASQEPHGVAAGGDGAGPSTWDAHAPALQPVPPLAASAANIPVAGELVAPPWGGRRPWGARRQSLWLMMAACLPLTLLAGVALGWAIAARAPVRPASLTVVSVSGSGGLHGHLIMLADQPTASLVLTHLPLLSHTQTYVCWLEHHGTMENACAFQIPPGEDDVSVLLHSTLPMGSYLKVAVAPEPSARAVRPSGTLLASASLP